MGKFTHTGIFVSIEGGDGGGKSMQAGRLCEWLKSLGIDTVLTCETYCQELRPVLWERDARDWSPIAEAMLLMADRLQHQEELILQALAEGKVVITDRYIDSTFIYQCKTRGLPKSTFDILASIAIKVMPTLTFVLDLPAEVGLSRKAGETNLTEDKYEQFGLDFHRGVNQAYRNLAAAESARCKLINAEQSPEEVQQCMQAVFKGRYPELFK